MESLLIVNPIKEPRQAINDILETLVVIEIHLFAFHGLHKTLALGIVIGVSTPAH